MGRQHTGHRIDHGHQKGNFLSGIANLDRRITAGLASLNTYMRQ
jgi:hypothetical protein